MVDYLDGWSELEATLPQAPHLGPVTVDRDADGTTCQLAWDCWADITTPAGAGQVADAAAALLRGMAACPSLTPPSALTPTRDPARPNTPGPGQAAGTLMTRTAADRAQRCLDQVREALTAQGFMANSRAGFCCMCSINGLNDGIPAMTDLAGTGALAAEFGRPAGGRPEPGAGRPRRNDSMNRPV